MSLVILVAGVYYGIHLGQPWFRYYQLVDEMRVSARLAPTLSDGVIRRRLEAKADELGLPPEAKKFQITRSGKPRRIVITTQYSETVSVPLLTHTFVYTPTAEEPL
ncbi:MAG: hypothetical protein SF070_12590 [Gemmatimonadota bacterium]|nr:hypothetical protein [Gemmatimonadota bacterium]